MSKVNSKAYTPKVGVFMPAYNQGQYIQDALDSLKRQTFQDFKVHIVDDASTDGSTIDILRSIDYDKAEIFLSEQNVGVQNLANHHFKALDTDYVFVLCADDMILPTYIEKCLAILENNKELGAVGSYVQCFGESDEKIEYSDNGLRLPSMLVTNRFLGSALMRREALKAIGWGNRNNESFRLHNDWDRWLSMLEAGYQLDIVKEPLFMYRILSSSLSHGAPLESEIKLRNALFDKHRRLYEKHFEYVVKSIWEEVLKHRIEYREYRSGHEWLDTEYKKQKSVIDQQRQEIDRLTHELSRHTKLSIYPLIRKVKHIVYGHK